MMIISGSRYQKQNSRASFLTFWSRNHRSQISVLLEERWTKTVFIENKDDFNQLCKEQEEKRQVIRTQ